MIKTQLGEFKAALIANTYLGSYRCPYRFGRDLEKCYEEIQKANRVQYLLEHETEVTLNRVTYHNIAVEVTLVPRHYCWVRADRKGQYGSSITDAAREKLVQMLGDTFRNHATNKIEDLRKVAFEKLFVNVQETLNKQKKELNQMFVLLEKQQKKYQSSREAN